MTIPALPDSDGLTVVRPPAPSLLSETFVPPATDADLSDPQAGWRDYSAVLVVLTRLYDRARRKGDRKGAWQFNEAIRILLANQDACEKALSEHPDGAAVSDHLRTVAIAFLELIERTAACVSSAARSGRIPGDWLGRCRVLASEIFDALGRYVDR